MAWTFGLSMECGPVPADAVAVARHFSSEATAGSPDDSGNWWYTAAPAGVSQSGIRNLEDAAIMTALGHRLYDRLRSAPPRYRYALVGVEAELFREYDELLAEDDPGVFAGLVLSDALWSTLGRPVGFEFFSVGYRWIPYRGEVVDPQP